MNTEPTLTNVRRCQVYGRNLLVVCLLVGMVIVAVQAKTLHYAPTNPQSEHFSASVKIANLIHHDSPRPQPVAVLAKLPEPLREQADFATLSDLLPTCCRPFIQSPQTRGPPSSSRAV